MPDGGYILLWRKFFEHRYWTKKRKFSEAEAWVDMIAMASFRDREILVGQTAVKLARVEFLGSVRFLAKRWRWSKDRVQRFLAAGKTACEIAPKTSTAEGYTYLVVNYDDYQLLPDSEQGQHPDSTRTAPGRNRKNVKEGKDDEPPKKNGRQGKDTWLTPFGEAWTAATGGEPAYGRMAKSLRDPVDEHGAAATLQGWKKYLKETEARYASPASFASRVGYWIGGKSGADALMQKLKGQGVGNGNV